MNYYQQQYPYQQMNYGMNNAQYGYGLGNYNTQNLQQQIQQPQITQQTNSNVLNGKIVDSKDIVKLTELPFKSIGVFPKGDMSEVYIKCWNDDCSTRIITYRQVDDEDELKKNDNTKDEMNETLKNIQAEIELIKEKIVAFTD